MKKKDPDVFPRKVTPGLLFNIGKKWSEILKILMKCWIGNLSTNMVNIYRKTLTSIIDDTGIFDTLFLFYF